MDTFPNNIGDDINKLPVDKLEPTLPEIQVIDTLFEKHKSTINKILEEGKDLFILGIIFILISLPKCDEILKRFIPIANNNNFLILIKAIIIIVVYWVVKFSYLSKNNK
jgi:hypothetical protein